MKSFNLCFSEPFRVHVQNESVLVEDSVQKGTWMGRMKLKSFGAFMHCLMKTHQGGFSFLFFSFLKKKSGQEMGDAECWWEEGQTVQWFHLCFIFMRSDVSFLYKIFKGDGHPLSLGTRCPDYCVQ